MSAVSVVAGIFFVLFICVLMELCRLRRKISSQKAKTIRNIPAVRNPLYEELKNKGGKHIPTVRNALYEELKKKGREGSAYGNANPSPHYEVIMGK